MLDNHTYSVNPLQWYSKRELEFTPSHFVIASKPLSAESKKWILHTLHGRFSTVTDYDDINGFAVMNVLGKPAFEDPKEALIYELTWG